MLDLVTAAMSSFYAEKNECPDQGLQSTYPILELSLNAKGKNRLRTVCARRGPWPLGIEKDATAKCWQIHVWASGLTFFVNLSGLDKVKS
jgi:hypothetical protein